MADKMEVRKGFKLLEYIILTICMFLICILIYVDNYHDSSVNVSYYVSSVSSTVESKKKININTANADELCTLTGIGKMRAKNIIDYRTKHGAFKSLKDLLNVPGIGEYTYNNLKDEICIK